MPSPRKQDQQASLNQALVGKISRCRILSFRVGGSLHQNTEYTNLYNTGPGGEELPERTGEVEHMPSISPSLIPGIT